MELLTMSGSELQRIEVLSEVLARKRTEVSAAAVLGLSTRQTRRLVRAYRDGGGGALINRTVTEWWNSSEHRDVMLGSFRRAGAGRAVGYFGGRLCTIWVARFGR